MNVLEDGISAPKKARVEIIPLIDVIFFLLATFVLFTLTLHRVRVVDAMLPQTSNEQRADDTTLYILASADGAFHWRLGRGGVSEAISEAELAPKLQDYKRTVSVPRVVVRSDSTARLRAAVVILDEVRRAQIKDVAIETIVGNPGS